MHGIGLGDYFAAGYLHLVGTDYLDMLSLNQDTPIAAHANLAVTHMKMNAGGAIQEDVRGFGGNLDFVGGSRYLFVIVVLSQGPFDMVSGSVVGDIVVKRA